ncbi:hypothetical protein FOL46_001283 [Perkinsus olseni]|uniref:Uncharacterized protein n=1 Tax=Perkinsus olseni TaxID=32597 RepID=A0A7J6KSD5_PEROL|nr:hypothetical protein FOL46_001283 [Perkinsus olseni]
MHISYALALLCYIAFPVTEGCFGCLLKRKSSAPEVEDEKKVDMKQGTAPSTSVKLRPREHPVLTADSEDEHRLSTYKASRPNCSSVKVKADDFVRALSEKGKRRSRTRSRANERRKKEETKEEESSTGTDTTGATSSDEGSDPSPAKKERDQSGVKLKAELEETSEA